MASFRASRGGSRQATSAKDDDIDYAVDRLKDLFSGQLPASEQEIRERVIFIARQFAASRELQPEFQASRENVIDVLQLQRRTLKSIEVARSQSERARLAFEALPSSIQTFLWGDYEPELPQSDDSVASPDRSPARRSGYDDLDRAIQLLREAHRILHWAYLKEAKFLKYLSPRANRPRDKAVIDLVVGCAISIEQWKRPDLVRMTTNGPFHKFVDAVAKVGEFAGDGISFNHLRQGIGKIQSDRKVGDNPKKARSSKP